MTDRYVERGEREREKVSQQCSLLLYHPSPGTVILMVVCSSSELQHPLLHSVYVFVCLSGIPTVIVANKCDMENGRVVRTDEGQVLASDLRSVRFALTDNCKSL